MKKYIYNNTIRIWMLLVAVLALSSCHVEIHEDPYDPTHHLCSYVWHDSWREDRFTDGHQELRFYPDGTGTDDLWFADDWGEVIQSSRVRFYWSWRGSSIRMEYPDGVSFLDNVRLDHNWLEGYLNDVWVDFEGY